LDSSTGAWGVAPGRAPPPPSIPPAPPAPPPNPPRPVVVDFIVHEDAQVWPMVAAGTSNDEVMAARGVRPDFGDGEDD
ncbi:acetolactate synthase large subunit, partial [Streptomyces sp. NPDC058861]